MDWKILRGKYVIYEDAHVLALNKPAGITVVGDRQKHDLLTFSKAAGELLYPVHRIDRATSGLVLFAKTQEVQSEITRQFFYRKVEKKYLAVVAGHVTNFGLIDLPLCEGRKSTVRIAGKKEAIKMEAGKWFLDSADVFPDRKNYPSKTSFVIISKSQDKSLLLITPITGRKHQIRVHLAWIGFPILGDPLFAKKASITSRMYLHSYSIKLQASWLINKELYLTAPVEKEFIAIFPKKETAIITELKAH
jgi:tRNA pseudouridine32 synthase/23S rRNA pseudouridine746 synthase